MTFKDFRYLHDKKEQLLELCHISEVLYSDVGKISTHFDKRWRELQAYETFRHMLKQFWNECKQHVTGECDM